VTSPWHTKTACSCRRWPKWPPRTANNISRSLKGLAPKPFHYKDLSALAVIGRNAAVADLGGKTFADLAA
jgi:hypothetical protein